MVGGVSTEPYVCESCKVPGQFASAKKFPEDKSPNAKEETYGVLWHCAGCNETSLDLCPIGAVEPTRTSCPNCGGEPGESEACPDCGMSPSEARAFLHIDDSASLSLENAEKCFDQGLLRRGFAILDALLKKDPPDANAWESRGTQYQILRLNRAAAKSYERALALAPNPPLDVALACARADLGDAEGALTIYDGLIGRADADEVRAIAHANRGNLHEAADRVDEAIADYEAALREEPERDTHYRNYARLFTKRKRWDEALAVTKRGLDLLKGEARVPLLVEKARSENELEQAEEASATADELLELSPDHPRGLYLRAWAFGLLGRLDEARETLLAMLDIEPDSKDAKKALAKIDAALEKAEAPEKKPWWKIW
jgi:tetratricopeptide (TPR) repeat protein